MATNLHVRSVLFTVFGLLSLIGTLGSSAPLAPAQASQVTNDIALTMSEDRGSVQPGGRVTFTVLMTDRGPEDATFVDVEFSLPTQLREISMACDFGISADTPFCEYSRLPTGATAVSRLVATLNTGVRRRAGLLKISASADFENPGILDPTPSNNRASVRLRLRLVQRTVAP